MNPHKPGYLTTEFWITLATGALTAFGTIPTPHGARGWVVALVGAVYISGRSLVKLRAPATLGEAVKLFEQLPDYVPDVKTAELDAQPDDHPGVRPASDGPPTPATRRKRAAS